MNNWQKLKKRKLEAPPSLSETTSNLQLPEVIGEKVDRRSLRKTGRTEQFATRVSKEWLEKVKEIAVKESLKLVEVLERMLEGYEKEQKTSNFKETVKEKFTDKLVGSEKERPTNQPVQPLNKIPANNYP